MKKSTLLLALASVVALGATAREMQNSSVLLQKAQVSKAVAASGIQMEAIKIKDCQKTGRMISPKSDVSAKYIEPEGLYTMGMTNTLSGYSYAFRFGPAFKELSWLNASEGATEYTWQYQDPTFEASDFLTTNSTDLTLMYPWSSFDGPILQATDGTTTSTYNRQEEVAYFLGGDTNIKGEGTLGVMTYDAPYYKDEKGYSYSSTGVGSYDTTDPEYYTSNGTYTGWDEILREDYSLEATDDVRTKSFINVFPKPASTISVSKVWAWINATVTEETTLNVALVKINDENQITNDTIAYGVATIPAAGAEVVEWDLYTVDEYGFENFERVNISSSFAVCIYGFDENPAVKSLTLVTGKGHVYDRSVEKFNFPINAYMEFEVIRGGESLGHLIEASPYVFYVDRQKYPSLFWGLTDFIVMVDAETWWLEADEYEYHFPNEGGSYDFDLKGHYPHALPDAEGNEYYWSAEPVDPEADVDWLEISFESQVEFDPEANDDVYNGVTVATFTAEPLPEGVEGRSVDVKVSYPGAELVISLSQGVLGVKDVTVKSAQYVNVVGNDFVVKATSDVTKAEVYTAAGVKVAEAAVNGTATINAAGLAHGVYFVKLNNGKTVKVVK